MSVQPDDLRIPPNPGGAIPAEHILGRDLLVGELWRHLDRQSIALFSPRRVGKTSVLHRMAALAPAGWEVRLRDLEGLDSPAAFAQYLYEDAGGLVGGTKGGLAKARALVLKLAGSIEIKNVKLTLKGDAWRRLLERLFEDMDAHLAASDSKLVFFWDEFTLFIGDVAARGDAQGAMVLLDTLRAARQRHPRIRMVLTGSVGFHLVMRQLVQAGYGNRPINDVRAERVPMLDPAASDELVAALLRGIDVPPDEALVAAVTSASEGHPFVVQHLVDRLRGRMSVTPAEIETELEDLLAPPSVLDLGHYAERLQRYYGEYAELAVSVLDAVAVHESGLHVDAIAATLDVEVKALVDVLRDLRDDDYLHFENRHARFALDFVRRYWVKDRLLA
ncbi:MAG: hypothetical protein JKY37_30870 [Nannocystaceae bacterium]|nr:hypothetical protein [Nannocystaceae bacterium]